MTKASGSVERCPFCGSDYICTDSYAKTFAIPPFPNDYFAYCEQCEAQGPPAHDGEEAIEKWNRRQAGKLGPMRFRRLGT